MMNIKTILFLIFLPFTLQAEVIKYEALKPSYQEYSFREVCEKLGAKHFELIEAKSMNEIDCMGKVFPAIDFCTAKLPTDTTLTRAIVDEKTKMVKCERSTSVMLALSCDKRDAKYCLDPQKGCDELKKMYAVKLDVAHFSLLENKTGKNINCYYSARYDL